VEVRQYVKLYGLGSRESCGVFLAPNILVREGGFEAFVFEVVQGFFGD
jgi:hypothetical protein